MEFHKARKPGKKCKACGSAIEPGQSYARVMFPIKDGEPAPGFIKMVDSIRCKPAMIHNRDECIKAVNTAFEEVRVGRIRRSVSPARLEGSEE